MIIMVFHPIMSLYFLFHQGNHFKWFHSMVALQLVSILKDWNLLICRFWYAWNGAFLVYLIFVSGYSQFKSYPENTKDKNKKSEMNATNNCNSFNFIWKQMNLNSYLYFLFFFSVVIGNVNFKLSLGAPIW